MAKSKIKKAALALNLELERTPDILAEVDGNFIRVGFAAESENLTAEATRKLAEKKLDLICANPIGEEGVGFDAEENKVTLLTRDGKTFRRARASKNEVAAWIWNQVEAWVRTQEAPAVHSPES